MIQKNSLVKLKNFSSRNNPNFIFSKLDNSLKSPLSLFPFAIQSKISLYKLFKVLKYAKMPVLPNCVKVDSLGWKLQENGFYSSYPEMVKKRNRNALRQSLSSRITLRINTFHKRSDPVLFHFDSRQVKSLARGFEKYGKFYGNSLEGTGGRKAFLRALKSRRFLSNIYLSRLFLFSSQYKKKYKSGFFYFLRRRQKVRSLLHLFALSSLKFSYLKRQHQKTIKRLAWKLKKNKKWKRHSSLFWFRQKLSQVFYIPKHFEINYKTLTSVHLGFTDFKSVNVRVPFWLNLRKLLTFLS